MKQKITLLTLALAAVLISGCSTVEPGKYSGNVPLDSLKTAYVVIRPGFDPKIGDDIREALVDHGVKAQTGSFQDMPKTVAFYVEYEDHWRWDLAMYLYSLDIRFNDDASGTVIGSGAFRQGRFHTFPDPRQTTFDVIDSIYKAK